MCNECLNKPICKIYNMMSTVNIKYTIHDCEHKNIKSITSNIAIKHGNDNVALLNNRIDRSQNDLSKLYKIEDEIDNTEKEGFICKQCDKLIEMKSHLDYTCSECNELFCQDCIMTITNEQNINVPVCEQCWEEM